MKKETMKKYVVWMAEKGCYDKKEYVRYIFYDENEEINFVKAMEGVLVPRSAYTTYDKDPKYYD